MQKILTASILSSMIVFTGCGTTDDTEKTCIQKLEMLTGDNPEIGLEGDTEIEISLGTNEILADDDKNVCAYDSQDGDISSSIERTNNIDFTRAGEYQVNYTVMDNDGNTGTAMRTVTIVDANNNTNSDSYGLLDPNNNNDSYTDNTNQTGESSDLGEQINSNNGSTYTGTGTDIENFKTWYYNTCGETFTESLYNATTSSYSGKIDCSDKGLDYIDLTPLKIFSSIDTIDLSHNNLTNIDFTPIKDIKGLNYLYINHNTATLKSKYDTVSERNALFRFFTYLHGGDGKIGLLIGFKPYQQDSDEEALTIHF